jgi:hypothetical protein
MSETATDELPDVEFLTPPEELDAPAPNRKTVPKQLKPFVKDDPRINRKGRPKDFQSLRKLAVKMGAAPAVDHKGAPRLDANGQQLTRIEAILLDWLNSGDVKKQELAVKYAYGSVPTEQRITGADGKALSPLVILLQELRGISADHLLAPPATPDDDDANTITIDATP